MGMGNSDKRKSFKAARSRNGKKKGENNRKCGSRYLGWAFIEAANFIRRYDPRAQRWHDRKAAETTFL